MTLEVTSIDLFKDWSNLIRTQLSNQSFDINGLSDNEISILHFTLRKRLISDKSRQIHKSDIFSCPENLQIGLSQLENKIINGESLRPNQSRKLQDLDDKDGMLFDWSIYHFHLGTTLEMDGFISRTGPLLYALVDDNNVYFIDVLNHGQWTNQNLLKIIHRNWPNTIDAFRIKDENIVGLQHNASDDEINSLRRANVNVLIEVEPGVIYVGPGGGLVASGHSAAAVNDHLGNYRDLEDLENMIKSNPENFLNPMFPNLDFIFNPELHFEMKHNGQAHELFEKNNSFSVLLNR